MSTILSLVVFIAAVAAAALTGSRFRPCAWYRHLEKTSWTLPKRLFIRA